MLLFYNRIKLVYANDTICKMKIAFSMTVTQVRLFFIYSLIYTRNIKYSYALYYIHITILDIIGSIFCWQIQLWEKWQHFQSNNI